MTRNEIIAVITRLYTGKDDDAEATRLVMMLEDELPNANVGDLIFHDFRGLTPEQVADEAIRIQAEHAKLHPI